MDNTKLLDQRDQDALEAALRRLALELGEGYDFQSDMEAVERAIEAGVSEEEALSAWLDDPEDEGEGDE